MLTGREIQSLIESIHRDAVPHLGSGHLDELDRNDDG